MVKAVKELGDCATHGNGVPFYTGSRTRCVQCHSASKKRRYEEVMAAGGRHCDVCKKVQPIYTDLSCRVCHRMRQNAIYDLELKPTVAEKARARADSAAKALRLAEQRLHATDTQVIVAKALARFSYIKR